MPIPPLVKDNLHLIRSLEFGGASTGVTRPERLFAPKIGWLIFSLLTKMSGISIAVIVGVGLLGTKIILKFVRKIVPAKLPLEKSKGN